MNIILTDKFPNVTAFADAEVSSHGKVTGLTRSVDALAMPTDLSGIRTIFTAFHHFQPREIEQIVASAQSQGEAPCAFDYVPSKPLTLALFPLTFVISFLQFYFLSFFVRPFRWQQLLFTNIVPIVPLVAAWDGFVSAMRKYDARLLMEMVEGRSTATYRWEVGTDNTYSRAAPLTYLIGVPVRTNNN